MAAVTRATKARPVMPPGEERTANGITLAGAALEAGDAVYLDGTNGWKLATAVLARAHQCGFAAQDYAIGRTDCSILLQGELEYGTDLTPGAPLWIGSVAGDLVDVAVTVAYVTTPDIAVPDAPKIYAATATRIRFTF